MCHYLVKLKEKNKLVRIKIHIHLCPFQAFTAFAAVKPHTPSLSLSVMGLLRIMRRFHGLYHTRTRNTAVLCNSYIQMRVLSSSCDRINGEDSILPVLIVGAGPVGLVLSILLTKLGEILRLHFLLL